MRLWDFSDPFDDRFAQASHIGAWDNGNGPSPSVERRPVVIEWEPGSTKVGDFFWGGTYAYMAKQTITAELISAGFKGFQPGSVEIVPNRHHKRRKRNIIQLPYEGPEVVEIYVTKWVTINRDRSTLRVTEDDNGEFDYDLEGQERIKHGKWHPDTGLERIRIPRTSGKGAYVDADQIGSCDIFRILELPGMVVCTDRFRDFVLEKGYTNIDFFEVGEVIESSDSLV